MICLDDFTVEFEKAASIIVRNTLLTDAKVTAISALLIVMRFVYGQKEPAFFTMMFHIITPFVLFSPHILRDRV